MKSVFVFCEYLIILNRKIFLVLVLIITAESGGIMHALAREKAVKRKLIQSNAKIADYFVFWRILTKIIFWQIF